MGPGESRYLNSASCQSSCERPDCPFGGKRTVTEIRVVNFSTLDRP